MDKSYWENLAPSHGEEIFSVFRNDKKKVIASAIRQHAAPRGRALDLGCAVGHWLPLLSEHFKDVIAVDISEKYIEIARERNQALGNIQYLRADISAKGTKLPLANLALCVNAMMMPSSANRQRFLQAIPKCLRPGGWLVLVLPALESALLAEFMIAEINRQLGLKQKPSVRDAAQQFSNLRQGIVDLDDIPYKHYLREEVEYLLDRERFRVDQIEKVEYGWETEMDDPPAGLGYPFPWDWLFVAQKMPLRK